MSSLVELDGVEVKYYGEEVPSLVVDELSIGEGELVLLLGPSGSGKSTLLKLLCGVVPRYQAAEVSGRVRVLGGDPRREGLAGMVRRGVAIVLQNPDAQLFSATVGSEVSFGPENLGLEPGEVRERVRWALEVTGMAGLEEKDTVSLSGGQKQRTVIASVLALRPKLLLLDEPASQLDPQGSQSVMRCVDRLPEEAGCAVVLAEHRLHDLYASGVLRTGVRAVVLDHGRVVFDGDVKDAISSGVLEKCGVREPRIIVAARRAYGSVPTLDRERLLSMLASSLKVSTRPVRPESNTSPIVEVDDAWLRYGHGDYVIRGASFTVRVGEVVALMGPNASGKTTLMRAIAGLLRPDKGRIRLMVDRERDVAYVPQNPDLFLVSDTVAEELRLNPRGSPDPDLVEWLVSELGIGDLMERHPHSLSRGQRFRVAVAAALAGAPRLVMLDEPTTGQDARNIDALGRILAKYVSRQQAAVLVSTHDVEFALHYCSKVVVLREGRVVASGDPLRVLSDENVVREAHLRSPDEVLVGAWS